MFVTSSLPLYLCPHLVSWQWVLSSQPWCHGRLPQTGNLSHRNFSQFWRLNCRLRAAEAGQGTFLASGCCVLMWLKSKHSGASSCLLRILGVSAYAHSLPSPWRSHLQSTVTWGGTPGYTSTHSKALWHPSDYSQSSGHSNLREEVTFWDISSSLCGKT